MSTLEQILAGPSVWPFAPRAGDEGDSERVEPCVPVIFIGPRDSGRTVALIDSGADRTMLPLDWAPKFGVTLERNPQGVLHFGEGGPALADCYRPVETLRATVAGRTFDLDALFGPAWEPVLGRSEFFREFVVTIDERNRTVILDPYREEAS